MVFGAPIALAFCGGERFVKGADPNLGGSSSQASGAGGVVVSAGGAAGHDGDGGSAFAGASGAPRAEGGMAGATEGPVTVAISIQNDADDAVFVRGDDEQLQYDMRVGSAESWRIGLVFRVSIPRGSRIEGATLSLTRLGGDAEPDDGLRVEVYESSSVPSFADTHMHRPEAHVSEGLWSKAVTGFRVGDNGRVESPDLELARGARPLAR